jgi:hypothetical protein
MKNTITIGGFRFGFGFGLVKSTAFVKRTEIKRIFENSKG